MLVFFFYPPLYFSSPSFHSRLFLFFIAHFLTYSLFFFVLLFSQLFRAATVEKRKQYVSLVDKVKGGGGDVHIFSALHVSGEQLAQVGCGG